MNGSNQEAGGSSSSGETRTSHSDGLFSHKRFLSAAFPQWSTIKLLPFALFPCLLPHKQKHPFKTLPYLNMNSEDAQISPLSNQGPASCMSGAGRHASLSTTLRTRTVEQFV